MDDLPDDLLALAARIDDDQPIDWDAEERDAPDAAAKAVVQGLRVLAGVASVVRTSEPEPFPAMAPPRIAPPPPGVAAASGTRRWGPIALEEAVGRGAFSTVYRAVDPLGRHVAVKLLDARVGPDDRQARVLAEGRLLASVKHKNIVMVHGADAHDGRVGLWMEFVHGRTLGAEVEARGPHGAEEAIVVGRALCGALAAVHAKGLVHGDVKAHNVMREDGGRVVLMDFGAGQSMTPSSGGLDVLAGTPLYLCPERLAGGPPSAATDVYALGVLLYYLVTERYPIEGASRLDVAAAHRDGRRIRLRDRRPDLPEAFVAAVERALSPDAAARFPTMGAFDEALAGVGAPLSDPQAVTPRPATIMTPAPRSRALRLGLAAVAALALATTYALWRYAPSAELPAATTPSAATVAAPDPGRFTVSGQFHATTEGGGSTPLAASTRIGRGTSIYLELEASRDVYVYVINEDERGVSTALFPAAGLPPNPLSGNRRHVLPERGGSWGVTSSGGREHLYVIASATPIEDIAQAVAALPQATEDAAYEGDVATRGTDRIVPRGIERLNRAPATDAARPWKRDAQPLTSATEDITGVWIRELVLENPSRR